MFILPTVLLPLPSPFISTDSPLLIRLGITLLTQVRWTEERDWSRAQDDHDDDDESRGSAGETMVNLAARCSAGALVLDDGLAPGPRLLHPLPPLHTTIPRSPRQNPQCGKSFASSRRGGFASLTTGERTERLGSFLCLSAGSGAQVEGVRVGGGTVTTSSCGGGA
eukprot:3656679-Rhodomonas_salina.4